jgi:hypothetical protein
MPKVLLETSHIRSAVIGGGPKRIAAANRIGETLYASPLRPPSDSQTAAEVQRRVQRRGCSGGDSQNQGVDRIHESTRLVRPFEGAAEGAAEGTARIRCSGGCSGGDSQNQGVDRIHESTRLVRPFENNTGVSALPQRMGRNARCVVAGLAYHITQRGTNREPVFFSHSDRRYYLELVSENLSDAGCGCWPTV